MRLESIKKGFTLIELLVVITIIWILATGAVSVYTSQIQKARDSTRLSDIKAVQSWVEQFYQDDGEYPNKGNGASEFDGVKVYVPKLPTDPKSGQASANSVFDYMYNVSPDSNTIPNQEYEISTHFEQQWNITSKAATDGGDDQYRMEIGINVSDASQSTIVSNGGWVAPTVISMTCVTSAGEAGPCTTAANPMIIKWN